MRFVLDNSVTMRWLFGDGSREDIDYARHVLEYLGEEGTIAVVPSLWALEAANVIARAEARGLVSEARNSEFIALLHDMPIECDAETFEHALGRTLHLARDQGLSSYDAAYLELSLREGIPLATLDADLDRALHAVDGRRLQ